MNGSKRFAVAYDLENDRLRSATARLLERHGCRRAQKSVFFGSNFSKKGFERLLADLERLTRGRLGPTDSVLVLPLTAENAATIFSLGDERAKRIFEPPPLFFRTEKG